MASTNQSSSMASNDQSNFHQTLVVLIPFLAQGHLNQLMHLSHLILSHNIPVHYVSTPTHNLQAQIRVHGWDPNSISNIHFHSFKVPHFASPPPNPNDETKFPSHLTPSFDASSHLREPVATLVQSLSCVARKVVVIYDSLMGYVVQDVQNITNVKSYVFESTCAFTTSMFHYYKMGKPALEKSVLIPELPSLEGCFTTQFMDFINAQNEFHRFNDGNIFNTTRIIEGPYMELMEDISVGKKNWALGPFNPLTIEEERNRKQSKQKFIWVIRDADKGDIFNEDNVIRHELPKGFEERVEGMGLVIRDWAPQLEILSHPSTGGFMSHCGWNSCIESITMGVPIAAWPIHSDQPWNSVFITQVLKIGFGVKDWAQRNELVTASDIEKVVRKLMETKEGEEMRQRVTNLKDAVHKSMNGGGVSSVEIDSFIAHITR
ncbi:hypothetical protein TanjilG_16819 [Lupinus angustifolius]|uniref:Glycosyltransferase n=1 Tax=Lupinus angustifolius TaxID=3871 RepID=A0A1J7H0K5_LUPAN|nr:hypothetical protein TanjilG_16819 [Lupinus angustifolius]